MTVKVDPSAPIDARAWWWRPESPKESIAGRLIVDPGDRGEVFFDGKLPGCSEAGTCDAVWGHVSDTAERVTLFRTLLMAEYGVNDNTGTRCLVKWVLLGAHLPPEAVSAVTRLRVRWFGAEDWYHKTLAPVPLWWTGAPIETAKLEPVLCAFRVDDLAATFELSVTARTSPKSPGLVEMAHEIWWELAFDTPVMLDDAVTACTGLRDLMWLMHGTPVTARSIQVQTNGSSSQKSEWVSLAGSICYRAAPERASHAHEMCLPYYAIQDKFPDIVGNWLKMRMVSNAGAFAHWRAVLSDKHMPIERHLVACAHFLDSLLPDVPLMPKQEFRRIADRVCDGLATDIPALLREAFERKIREANRGTYRDCLTAALATIPALVVQKYELDQQFVRDVGVARNRLTHDGDLGDVELPDAVMLSARLRIFAVAYVLTAIGVPPDRVMERLTACRTWAPPESVGAL